MASVQELGFGPAVGAGVGMGQGSTVDGRVGDGRSGGVWKCRFGISHHEGRAQPELAARRIRQQQRESHTFAPISVLEGVEGGVKL